MTGALSKRPNSALRKTNPIQMDYSINGFLYRRLFKTLIFRFFRFLTLVVFLAPIAFAQKNKPQPLPPPAPVPPQIATAQRFFISNGGGESFEDVIDQVVFDGGPDRPYNEFYASMKSWGQREIVLSPSEADLILTISWALTDTGLRLPVLGQLRLSIVDPKTHVTLWTVTEYVRGAVFLDNRNKNFDQAMNIIVNRAETLLLPAPAGTPAK